MACLGGVAGLHTDDSVQISEKLVGGKYVIVFVVLADASELVGARSHNFTEGFVLQGVPGNFCKVIAGGVVIVPAVQSVGRFEMGVCAAERSRLFVHQLQEFRNRAADVFCDSHSRVVMRRNQQGVHQVFQIKNLSCLHIELRGLLRRRVGGNFDLIRKLCVFEGEDSGENLGGAGVGMAFVRIFGKKHFPRVRVDKQRAVRIDGQLRAPGNQNRLAVELVGNPVDGVGSLIGFAVGAEIIPPPVGGGYPACAGNAVFSQTVVVSVKNEPALLIKKAFVLKTEVILFSVNGVPAVPAVSAAVDVVGLSVNQQESLFGESAVLIAVVPTVVCLDKFSCLCRDWLVYASGGRKR